MSLNLRIHAGVMGLHAELTEGKTQIARASVSYGEDLPQFNTPKSFIVQNKESVFEVDPRMWTEALGLALLRLRDAGAPLAEVESITGCGQSGSMVCVDAARHFTRLRAPMKADFSCASLILKLRTELPRELQLRCGGFLWESDLAAHARSFFTMDGEAYARTARIYTCAGFLCSYLIQADAPISYGDASRTHLLDLHTREWSPELTHAIAPGLLWKLPPVGSASQVAGGLAPLFERYGLRAGIPVYTWTGEAAYFMNLVGADAPGKCAVLLHPMAVVSCVPLTSLRVDESGVGRTLLCMDDVPCATVVRCDETLASEPLKRKLEYLLASLAWTKEPITELRITASGFSEEEVREAAAEIPLPIYFFPGFVSAKFEEPGKTGIMTA